MRSFVMTKAKKRAASIHLDPDLWDRVERLAQQERRPISQFLRNIVADAVSKSSRDTAAGSDMVAA
jgi:predicted transcriptional regulator